MSDTPTNEPAGDKPEGTPAEGGSEAPKEEPKTFDEKYVTDLRNEAASWRTKLREAEDKLKDAKTPEELEALRQEMAKEREDADKKAAETAHQLLVENVALKFGLPEKLAKKLTGKTREELESDAKELAEFAPKKADEDNEDDTPLEGGLSPRNRDSDPDDPRALAAKYGRRRR